MRRKIISRLDFAALEVYRVNGLFNTPQWNSKVSKMQTLKPERMKLFFGVCDFKYRVGYYIEGWGFTDKKGNYFCVFSSSAEETGVYSTTQDEDRLNEFVDYILSCFFKKDPVQIMVERSKRYIETRDVRSMKDLRLTLYLALSVMCWVLIGTYIASATPVAWYRWAIPEVFGFVFLVFFLSEYRRKIS